VAARIFRLAALALAAALVATPPPATAQEQTLTARQMKEAAALSISAGRPDQAVLLADALLQRDPQDIQALLLRARASRDLGRYAASRQAARAAWRGADAPLERYGASLAMAQALASDGRRLPAQWWLRRAAHHAPDPQLRARALRDFRYVRERNPWSTELHFAIAPRSNINNGSANDTVQLYGLPFDFQLSGAAQALSGTEISGGIATRYRLGEAGPARTELLFQLHHRTYRLSDEARRKAPGVDGHDFAFSAATAGLAHSRPAGQGRVQGAIIAGRTWYGGDPYMQLLRLAGARQWALGQRTGLTLSLAAEAQQGLGRAEDARVLRLGTGLVRVIEGGHRLHLDLGAERSHSDADWLDYSAVSAGLRLDLARPVLGLELEMGLSARYRQHDSSRFTTSGREETEIAAEITAILPGVEYYGFVPSLTLRAARTESSVALYDSEETGLHLGFRSAF